jgi:hypothetical protein
MKDDGGLNTIENKALSDRESKEFYGRWKDILENQLSLEYNESDADDIIPGTTTNLMLNDAFKKNKTGTQQIKVNNFTSTTGGAAGNPGYSYDNLLRMLDLQLKSKVRVPDNQFIQKQISQSIENRYKMKTMFSEHSNWLKNIKTQVIF